MSNEFLEVEFMAEKNAACARRDLRESVCINVDRVYDCCKDRDCITDARVYVSDANQQIIDRAVNVKAMTAEVLWTYIDVEALPFNRGFYTVDIKIFFRIGLDVFANVGRPQRVYGLSTFDKKVILYGSEGNVKTYSSSYVPSAPDTDLGSKTNAPKATVELVEPIALAAKLVDSCTRCGCGDTDLSAVPACICRCFEECLCDNTSGNRVYVSLGLFSIVRLMREVQILVPSYDFCIPEKECQGPSEEDPCSLFYRMDFPVDEFFPSRIADGGEGCECSTPAGVAAIREEAERKNMTRNCGCRQ